MRNGRRHKPSQDCSGAIKHLGGLDAQSADESYSAQQNPVLIWEKPFDHRLVYAECH